MRDAVSAACRASLERVGGKQSRHRLLDLGLASRFTIRTQRVAGGSTPDQLFLLAIHQVYRQGAFGIAPNGLIITPPASITSAADRHRSVVNLHLVLFHRAAVHQQVRGCADFIPALFHLLFNRRLNVLARQRLILPGSFCGKTVGMVLGEVGAVVIIAGHLRLAGTARQ